MLDNEQRERLWTVVTEVVAPPRLAELLDFRIDKKLHNIAFGGDYREVVFKVIEAARMEGWLDELFLALVQARPKNTELFALSQEVGLASTGLKRRGLELVIREKNGFLDVAEWRSRLGEIEGQICRIAIDTDRGEATGTGFLVGPDVVLTNYHVIEPVILGERGEGGGDDAVAKRDDVVFTFDFKVLPGGKVLNSGTSFALVEGEVEDWLIDESPDSAADDLGELPEAEELDYALVRLASSPGTGYLGGAEKADRDAPKRGFVEIPEAKPELAPGQALFIVQHPDGEPLKLAFDTDSVILVNEHGSRVRYKTNTLPGSSGSPCFDVNWQLVAIHHYGDPNYTRIFRPAEYNQGIPIAAIRALLTERGLADALGAG